jgi:hypothetical protein
VGYLGRDFCAAENSVEVSCLESVLFCYESRIKLIEQFIKVFGTSSEDLMLVDLIYVLIYP